jgi:hypothetical protein
MGGDYRESASVKIIVIFPRFVQVAFNNLGVWIELKIRSGYGIGPGGKPLPHKLLLSGTDKNTDSAAK